MTNTLPVIFGIRGECQSRSGEGGRGGGGVNEGGRGDGGGGGSSELE